MAIINQSKTLDLNFMIVQKIITNPFGTNVANLPDQLNQTFQNKKFDILTIH